jgi:hypothetical protein
MWAGANSRRGIQLGERLEIQSVPTRISMYELFIVRRGAGPRSDDLTWETNEFLYEQTLLPLASNSILKLSTEEKHK